MARASGGANNKHPLSWGGAQTEKIPLGFTYTHMSAKFQPRFLHPKLQPPKKS